MRIPEMILAIVTGLILGAAVASSQDTKPSATVDKPPEKMAIKSEVDKYKYQALTAKYQLDDQQVNNLVLQFLNGNDNVKTIRAHQVELMSEINPLRKKIFDDHKLSPEQWDIQGDPPELVPIKK